MCFVIELNEQVEEIFKSARNHFVSASTYPTSKDDLNLKLIDIVKVQASSFAVGGQTTTGHDVALPETVSVESDLAGPDNDLPESEGSEGDVLAGNDGGIDNEEEGVISELEEENGEESALSADQQESDDEDVDISDKEEESNTLLESGEAIVAGIEAADDLDDIDEDEDW